MLRKASPQTQVRKQSDINDKILSNQSNEIILIDIRVMKLFLSTLFQPLIFLHGVRYRDVSSLLTFMAWISPVVGVPRDLVHGDVLAVGDDGGLEELGHVDDDGEEEDGEDEHQQAAAGRVLASQGLSQNRICVKKIRDFLRKLESLPDRNLYPA